MVWFQLRVISITWVENSWCFMTKVLFMKVPFWTFLQTKTFLLTHLLESEFMSVRDDLFILVRVYVNMSANTRSVLCKSKWFIYCLSNSCSALRSAFCFTNGFKQKKTKQLNTCLVKNPSQHVAWSCYMFQVIMS